MTARKNTVSTVQNEEKKKNSIRPLLASEIECRVGTMKPDGSGCSLLLYKDARVDMRILDEVFGEMNWKRHHDVVNGNLFCTLSIWDNEKKEWVSKQDVGIESSTEKRKGRLRTPLNVQDLTGELGVNFIRVLSFGFHLRKMKYIRAKQVLLLYTPNSV